MKTKFKIPIAREELVTANSLEELITKFAAIGSWTWSMTIADYTINIELIPDEANYCVEAIDDPSDWTKFRDFEDILEAIDFVWTDIQRTEFYSECNKIFTNWFMRSVDYTTKKQ